MEKYIEDLILESRQLDCRIGKFERFLEYNPITGEMREKLVELMNSQLKSMRGYRDALESRLDIICPIWRSEDVTFDFGKAIEFLKAYECIKRLGWNGKNMFVFRNLPASISRDELIDMNDIPVGVKSILISSDVKDVDFGSRMMIVNMDTKKVDNWVPSVSDIFATDWTFYKN